MGLLSHVITYKIGKTRGERRSKKSTPGSLDARDPDCLNYAIFCRQFGSCDGQKCEFEDKQ